MSSCLQNTLKCLSGGLGVFTYIPTTTTTTVDPLCYLVDCEGNYIVDCSCNYIVGCPCDGSVTTTSTTSSTTTSSVISSTTTSTSTTSFSPSSSTSTTTSTSTTAGPSSSTTTSTTTTGSPSELLVVPEGANLISFGDSYTTTLYVGPANHYTTLLANDLGISVTRYAVGNSGFKTLMGKSNDNLLPNTNVVTELTGLNNVYYEGDKANNTSIIGHGLLTLFANQWASSFTNGANASMNKVGGTFTGYAAATEVILVPGSNAFGGKYGKINGQSFPNTTDAIYTASAGAYIEHTTTFKYAIVGLIGGNGVFSSYNSTTIPSGTVNVYVDNVLQTTVNLSQQYPLWPLPYDGFGPDNETMGPVMVPLIMPSTASRTIKVELVSGNMALDYIAVLDDPANCYPLVVAEIPYTNPVNWGVGSEAIADNYSSIKQTYVNLYKNQGFPVRYCVINAPAGPYSYLNTDGTYHPNILGNQQLAAAFEVLFA